MVVQNSSGQGDNGTIASPRPESGSKQTLILEPEDKNIKIESPVPSNGTSPIRGSENSGSPREAHAHFAPQIEEEQHQIQDSSIKKPLDLDDGKKHILLACTGSVATIKIPLIVEELYQLCGRHRIAVHVLATEPACHFLRVAKLQKSVPVWRDKDEWLNHQKFSDPVLHTELRRWAHLLVISPMSANTLAKMAAGLSDNLVLSVIRAWSPTLPIIAAPAMNTYMYNHPLTSQHINKITQFMPNIEWLKPVEKMLICGDIGMGGMHEWRDIVLKIIDKIGGIPHDDGTIEWTSS